MAEIKNTEVFNQEIAELEAKLAAKKQELVRNGVESPEKDVFKHVVKEHAAQESIPMNFAPSQKPAPAPVRVPTKEEEQKISTFIAHAFTKGIASAVAEAKKTGDAYFVDLLHDRLADEYYQKLLQARKIIKT